jgi:hypothetical protein
VAWKVSLVKTGSGSGNLQLSWDGGQIDCGTECSAIVPSSAQARVEASTDAANHFDGFAAACLGTIGTTCMLDVNSVTRIEGIFAPSPPTVQLAVANAGTGSGRVVSTPSGIDCRSDGGTCAASFPKQSVITLSAEPDLSSTFVKWMGVGCGSANCLITLDNDLTVEVEFSSRRTLNLSAAGGIATAGIALNGAMFALPFHGEFAQDTTLQIQALPADDDTSLGWIGLPCSETLPLQRCTILLAQDMSGTLSLRPLTRWLVGGWSGAMQFADILPLGETKFAVLTTFAGGSNFASPPLTGGGPRENLLFELNADGGVGRWVQTVGGGPARFLSATPSGLFAVGVLPSTGFHSLQWGSFDAGAPFQTSSEFVAVHIDETNWQPNSVVLHADAGLDRFVIGNFHQISQASVVATFAPSLTFPTEGTTLATFSHDFSQLKSSFGYAGAPGILPSDGFVYALSGRFRDGGTGFGECPGLLPSANQVFLARLTEGGQCLSASELPVAADPEMSLSLGTEAPPVVYGQGGRMDGGLTYARFYYLDTNSAKKWESPAATALTPSGVGGLSAGAALAWQSSKLLGYFFVADTVPVDLLFTNGLTVHCPTPSPFGAVVLTEIQTDTGEILWAHCMPGQSSSGVPFQFRAIERLADSFVLTYSSRNPSNSTLNIGRLSVPVAPNSPVFLSVTPPL